jgi:signal peptidase I
MSAPPRILRILFAWLGYSSVHWAAGRWRRALAWDVALFASLMLVFYIPVWILVVLIVGQIVDAAVIKPVRARSTGGYAIAMLIAICVGVFVQITMRAVWVEAFKIPSGSSIPTLLVGDHVFVAKNARHPSRGDNTVFIYPKERDKDFIKRVVAVGGDTVEIRDNQLILNGQPVPRVHVDGPCEYDDLNDSVWEKRGCEAWDETLDGRTYRVIFDRSSVHSFRPVTVPPDNYFVLGDNRDNSHDSRFWGFVPQPLIKGVVRKIWWSSGPEGVRWDRIDKRVP